MKDPASRPARFGTLKLFAAGLLMVFLAATSGPLASAPVTWDNEDLNNLWDSINNWSNNLLPTAADDLSFLKPFPGPSSTITLGAGEVANSLSFFDQYTLTGGTLALTSGQITVTIGNASTIASQLTGSGGLLKLNDGALILTNAANDYSGTTQIDAGSVIITGQGALGTDSSAVIVTGNATRGVGGGSLVVGSANNNLTGLTFTRDLALTGGGPSGDGAAFNSVGNNTFTGSIVTGGNPAGLNPAGGTPVTISTTRLASTFGTATVNGTLTVDPSGASTEFTGNGNWLINSNIDGAGNVIKSGNGLLVLAGNNSFGGVLQLSGGYVRVSSEANLGSSLANNGVFLTNSGRLEIRTDTPDLTTSKRVQLNTGTTTGYIYLDREIGGSGLNQDVTLGLFTLAASTGSRTLVIDGRNGYNLSFSGNMATGSSGNLTVTNNGNGLFTYAGNFYNTTNTTARTLTFNGNGDFLITGGILASGANHAVTKAGNGTLTLEGTNSSFTGDLNINAGTVAIRDFRAINNAAGSGVIKIGNTTTTSTLSIVGNNLAGANVTTSKVVNLGGTTGGAIILVNQTGTSPGVRFEADFTATGAGSKTLTLGGTSAQDNTIAGAIVNNSGTNITSLLKIDSGTWVLAGANTYTGTTTITNGSLKLEANAATSTVLSVSNDITFGNNNVNAGGTLEFVGQAGVNNVQALGTLSYASSGGAATVRLTPGLLGTASLTFANLGTGGGGTINFVGGDFTNNTVTISNINGSAGSDGIITRSVYWNGADFAYREGGVLRAPVYGTDGDTATSATALTAGAHNEVTGSFSTPSVTVDTLKINGGHTLTIDPGETLTLGALGLLATGGNATITGGDALAIATASQPIVIRVDGGADSLRIETGITGSGGLTKSGAGTLVLAGANAQTGTVNIGEGIVRLTGTGTLSAADQTVNIRQNAVLDLNGVGSGTAIGQFSNNGTVTNTSATDVLLSIGNGVTTNGTAGTSYGIIEDGLAGGQTSVSLSTDNNNAAQNTNFYFNGLSTYTGPTTLTKTAAGNLILNAPTLADIGQASSIGSGDAGDNAGSLVFAGAASAGQVFATLNYNGSASLSTDRLFTFGGTVSGSGARIRANGVNDATLIWSNTGALAFGTADIDQGLALGGASVGSNQFNPRITDNGTGVVSLYKQDAGLWILGNNANSYSGVTQIDAGALRAEGTTLPAGSPLVFNGGVLQSGGTFSRSLTSTPTAGAGGVHWAGNGGFAAATENLTVNIGGNVTPDTLQWGVGGFVSGNLILSSTTAFAEVEILNPIDLNGAARTIQVDLNGTTNSDLATLSGVISGAAGSGLTKTGGGILRLLADNTFIGDTNINGGTVRAVSIGNSSSTASNFGTGVGKINIGNAGTSGTLAYVGGGETTDRLIELGGTTASVIIESSGTGPLVLTNVVNVATGTGAKTFYLRGDLNAANEITSALDNGVGTGALNVTKDDNGMWILSGDSTFTGNTTVSVGALGVGIDSTGAVGSVTSGPVGTGKLIVSNGSLFALNGARVINNDVQFSGNANPSIIGINSLTLNGNLNTTTGGNTTVTNSLPAGAVFTINSPTYTGTEASTTRTLIFRGGGDTVLNSSVTDSTGGAQINLTYDGYGSLTLGGSNGASTYTGATTISSGTLKVGSTDAIPSGPGKGDVVMNPAAGLTATLDLNGFDQTVNGLTAASAGTANIDNSSATAVTFTFGSQDSAVNLIGGVNNSGGGALSLDKIGTGTATLNQGPFTYTGDTTVSGGSLTLAADVSGTTALTVGAGALLRFTDGFSGSALVTSIDVGAGGDLRFLNSAGEPLSNLTSLTLGAGTTLGLNAGATSDTLTLLAPNVASVGGAVGLAIRDTGSMLGGTTYNLLEAASGGLTTGGGSSGSYSLAAIPGGFTTLTLNQSDTLVSLTTGTLVSDTRYWTGATDTVWNTVNGTFDGLNWSPDKSGATVSAFIPGSGTTVVFSADNNAEGGALVTTLEQGFRVNSLEFESSTTTPTSVAINPGSDPLNRLIISPVNSADGVNLKSGGPGAVSIAAPLRIDVDQTWTVADSSSMLTVSGALGGPGALVTDGPGTITVAAAAGGTFAVPTVLVSNGTLRTEDVGALGTTVAANAAAITINSGAAFYYYGPNNTAATAVNNALTLAGGTLSAGGATGNHYYTGAVNVTADSFINLRDSNSATTSDPQTNIILNGPLTGTGKLSVDSSNALSGGNPFTGTLYLQNDNSGWSGGFDLTRGTIQVQTNLNAFGTGDVTASAGRIQFNLPANNTVDLAQNFTVDAPGGILELSVDAQSTLSGDLTVNLNGVVTLGSNANANNALRITQNSDNFSVLNIPNSVVLGNDASITYQGNANRPFEISGVISETGGSRSLAINDELYGWGVTSRTVRLSAANTFTGDISLSEGALEFSTVSDIGGPASNLGQGSGIGLAGGTFNFIGDTVSQSTNRPIDQTGAATFAANGTNGATITYAGALSGDGNTITLTGTGEGFFTGTITQTGTAADVNVNSGIWHLGGTGSTIADDVIVTATSTGTAVLNLDATGTLSWTAGTSNGLYARDGAVINLNADDVNGIANSGNLSYILLGDTPTNSLPGTLNTNTFSITTPRLDLGGLLPGRTGIVTGSGTIIGSYTGTDYAQGFRLFAGSISANLAGTSTILKQSLDPVTLSGNNSGLTATVATRVDSGTLILDYSASNTVKLSTTAAVDLRGGTIQVVGNNGAATSETLKSLTLGAGGSSEIQVTGGAGQDAVLNLGAITRANRAADGTIRFILPSGVQSATNGITTTSPNSTSGLLGNGSTSTNDSAYATVDDGTGVWFAKNDGFGNIVAQISTPKNDVSTWRPGEHITDETTGFTGTLLCSSINSLRFDAAAGSDLLLSDGANLTIASGGILLTSNVGNSPTIIGGSLTSGAGEIIITHDSAATFEISSSIGGDQALTKTGAGTLLLTGVNTYTEETEIQEGTLQVNGSSIGDTSPVNLADDHVATLQLLNSEAIGRLTGGSNADGLNELATVDIGTHTLTLNSGTGNATYAGKLAGSGTLVKNNAGTNTNQAFTGASTGFNGTVIVNGGLFQFSSLGAMNATDYTLNSGSSLLIDNNGTTTTGARILDTATITLNSADGAWSGTTLPSGLTIRRNQNSAQNETVGVITARSGASYARLEATGGSSSVAQIIAADIVRMNNATLDVRGSGLGNSSGQRTQLRINDATNQTAFIAAMIGGGSTTDGTANRSIVPWVIGEETAAAVTDDNMGNSLVTYVSGRGFQALDLATEYTTIAGAGATDNARESLGSDLTGVAGTTVNSLVIDNAAIAGLDVTGSGAGQALANASGTFLFTVTGGAASTGYDTTLGGFDDGITTGSGEYVIFVQNPSSAATTPALTATISSPLTSAADITKSGRGTLILTETNLAGGGAYKTTINEGILEISDLDNIGGNTGDLFFSGGTLRLSGTYSGDDVSSRLLTFFNGGATIDTNGNSVTLASSIGNGGGGGFTKTGTGSLTLGAGADYAGNTSVQDGSLIVNSGASMPATGSLTLGSGTTSGVVQLGDSGVGTTAWTVTSLATSGSGTANAIVGGGAAGSLLTVNQDATTTYAGSLGGAGANENNLGITKSGIGSLTLAGDTLSYTGPTTVSGGTLNIAGSAATPLATSGVTVARGAALHLLNSAGQTVTVSTLDLGSSGTGVTVLGLELGSAYDSINTAGAAVASGDVHFHLAGISGFGAGTYDLLTAASGLDGASYSIGDLSGALTGVTLSLTTDPTFVRLGAAASTGNFYWQGGIDSSWLGNCNLNTNFTTDLAGTTNANGTPGAASTVIFSTTDNAQGPVNTTTLDADFTINDLQFNANPAGITGVVIASGTPTTSSLTITPSSSSDGIVVGDNAGAVLISAPLGLGADQTWDIAGTGANGSSLTVSGAITGAANLTKTGAGTVTLSNNANAYAGTTIVSDGVLQAGVTNGFNNTSAHVINGAGILRLNNFSAIIGSLAGSGTVENSGIGTDTLTVGGDNTSTVFSGTLQDGASGSLRLDKVGTGTLELSGTSTSLSGNLTVQGGMLKMTGTVDNVAGGTGTADLNIAVSDNTSGMVYVSGTGSVTTDTITIGNGVNNRTGSLVIDGGDVTLTALAGAGINVGSGGYGYVGLQSGSLTGNRFESNNNGNGVAVFRVDGGTLTSNEFLIFRNLNTEFTVTGGEVRHDAASAKISLTYQNSVTTVMTIAGGTVYNNGRAVQFGETNNNTNNYTGILNLNGGNLITDQIISTPRGTTSETIVNFNGGTLTAAINETGFFNAAARLTTYVHSGGAIIDTAGSNVTISESLKAPAGDGLTSLTVSNAGSGYIGAPYVEITGGSGTGATAYATVDLDPSSPTFGQLTGVTVSNPGTGYLNTDSLTISLLGGGGSGAVIDTPTFAANASGGLTKQGSGTLTLTGLNTYTGGTTITGGTLALGVNDALESTGAVTVQGGSFFDLSTFTNTVGQVTLEDGNITGTTGVLTSTADYDLRKGAVSAILAGSVGLNKTTADTVTLSGANTFSGVVSVTGGTLAFDSAANLGNAANPLTVDGATLSFTGITTETRAGTLTVGSGGATLDTAFAAGTLELTGGIMTSTAANLIKTGPGTVTVTGTTDLTGGAVTVSGGTLNAGFSATGISGVTVASGGTLNLFDNSTITSAISALSLANGSSLGFDLNAPGTNDVLALTGTPALAGTIALNFNDLGGLGVGTYDLVTATGGGLNSATYVLGSAPSGLNYSFDPTVAGNTILRLTTTALVLRYWQGDQDASWSSNNGGNTNWAADAAGTIDLGALPAATDTLVFSTSNNTQGPVISTTLDGVFTADGLQFTSSPAGVTSFTVAQGSGGSLTLSPVSPNNGIVVGDNAGSVTISSPLFVAATNQTWEVAGTGANGSSLTLSGDVSFAGSVTKTGDGTLTLSGANTGAGGLTVNGGTLNLGSATAPGTGTLTTGPGITLDNTSGSALTLSNNNALAWNGSFTFTGTDDLDLGTGAVTLGNNAVVTVAASTLSAGGNIGDGGNAFALTKTGAGTLVLNGANTFAGGTTLSAGTLHLGNASALGTGAFTIGAGTTFDNSSGSAMTLSGNLAQNWEGDFTFTGSDDLNLGTGAVALNNPAAVNVAAGTLTVGGVIDDGVNANALTKTGTGTLLLTGLSTYDGRTLIDEGTLKIGANDALPALTVVRLGSGTTVGTLDLDSFDQTIAGLLSESTTDAVTNQLIINTGKALTVNGAVTLGADAAASSTKLVASGGGNLVVNSGGSNFQVGGSTSTGNYNAATVDLSGLSNFTADLGLGTLKVGDVNSIIATNTATSDLRLATNNTITAGFVAIGEGTPPQNLGDPHSLILGSGTNIVNSNTIAVGSGNNSNRARSSGEIVFDPGDTTGTLTIRGSDGVSAALTLQMVNSTSTTGNSMDGTIDLTGHSADVLVNDVNMARRTQGTGNATATLSFDQGTFQLVDDLVMAHRVTSGTGNATATLNIGGGAFIVGDATAMSLNTGTDPASVTTATVNITGGDVTFAGALNMANAATGQTANSAIHITGGTMTVGANITRTGGGGTENAVITLNGGTLDMGSKDIGTAADPIAFNAQSGTLKNLNELNGGGTNLIKTAGAGANTLILEGTNTYSGATSVTAGILLVNADNSGATGSVTVDAGATLGGNGTLGGNTTVAGTLSTGVNAGVGTVGSLAFSGQDLTFNSGSTWLVDISRGALPSNDSVSGVNLLTVNATTILALDFGATPYVPWEVYTLASFAAGGWNGTAFSIPEDGDADGVFLAGGGQYRITYDNPGGSVFLQAIPEPGSALPALVVLVLGLFLRRGRRRG